MPPARLLAGLLALAAALPAAPSAATSAAIRPHPNSISSSRVTIEDARVAVELSCQALSLIEVLPIDGDADGHLSQAELAAARAKIEAYLLARYVLAAPPDGNRALDGRLESVSLRELYAGQAFEEQWIDARLAFPLQAGPLRELWIEVTLFRETNPFHTDHSTIAWADGPSFDFVHSIESGRARFADDAERPRAFVQYVELGVEHILTGYDHLAFLAALLVAAAGLRQVVAVVTAFTVSHSVTLALAALGHLDFVPGRVVECAIALSIAYVATENLLSDEPRRLWITAFGFGLIHGVGFAGALADALGRAPDLARILYFNLGVELGQLAVALACIVLLALVRRRRGSASADDGAVARLSPRRLELAVSSVVAALGLWWFVERAWLA
jgi:hypothetical protein